MKPKTILITGSTDGIGLETARMLFSQGHRILLHGRKPEKMKKVKSELNTESDSGFMESYVSDLSSIDDATALAHNVAEKHPNLDVLINNAGVYHPSVLVTQEGLDTRFVVNTIAPYILAKCLSPILGPKGRIVNVSSAAQAPLSAETLGIPNNIPDGAAYAQSKLALTMWSRHMALSFEEKGPVVVAVNPASMLGSKMVKEAYGVDGGDLRIGADILCRAALSDEFAGASGKYYDNDSRRFTAPHPDALNPQKCKEIVRSIETIINTKRNA